VAPFVDLVSLIRVGCGAQFARALLPPAPRGSGALAFVGHLAPARAGSVSDVGFDRFSATPRQRCLLLFSQVTSGSVAGLGWYSLVAIREKLVQ
jgi:hypothetical protein